MLLFFAFSISNGQITWTGNTDNDWHKTCNWSSNTIPTCLQDVIIPTAKTVNIAGIAHCKTIDIQGTAVINITGSGKLEVSDANACVGTKTDSGGCLIPSSAWTDDGSTNQFGVFTCFGPIPAQSSCKFFTNNTDYAITLNLSSIVTCGSWAPSNMPTIPAKGSLNVCLNTPAGCCPFTNANPYSIPWTATDLGSGTITVIVRTDID